MRRQVTAMAIATAVTLTLVPLASDARPRPAPRIVVAPPPTVYLVPGFADVYFYRVGGNDVFFAAGYWWTSVGGMWYQAAYWQGPWVRVAPAYVPSALVRLPPRWHHTWHRWDRVPWQRVEARRHAHPAPRPGAYVDRPHRAGQRVETKAPPRAQQKSPARDARSERRGGGQAHAQNRPAPRR